jgi:hypothetical protein
LVFFVEDTTKTLVDPTSLIGTTLLPLMLVIEELVVPAVPGSVTEEKIYCEKLGVLLATLPLVVKVLDLRVGKVVL